MSVVNYGTHLPGLMVVPFVLSGQRTTTTAAVVTFNLPFPALLLDVQASARASSAVDAPTLTVDVQEGGVTVLDAPIAVTAGESTAGVIADGALADEAEITIDLAIGGDTPTWDDIMVMLTLLRTD